MNLLGLASKEVRVESMAAGCKIGESYVQSSICEVSRCSIICTIPSSRIKDNLMEMLDREISISLDNMLLDGIFSWYTIEDSLYRIGITIAPKHRSSWRKILSARCRVMMQASTRTASV